MPAQIITVEDLQQFKTELLRAIGDMLRNSTPPAAPKWLKAHEVRQLLGISPGTLQTMRNTRKLPYSKVGGLTFYDYEDVCRFMNNAKKSKPR